jgi:hypothetical protein
MNFSQKVLAICTTDRSFPDLFKNPLWTGELARQAREQSYQAVTGKSARDSLKKGRIQASDILVVADEDSGDAQWLLEQGARGACLVTQESPAVKWRFFDKIISGYFNDKYSHLISWSTALEKSNFPEERRFEFYPPCYYGEQDLVDPIPWDKRKFLIFVGGLRIDHVFRNPLRKNERTFFQNLRREIKKSMSPTFWYCRPRELQSKKLEAVLYFSQKKRIDVFGYNWGRRELIPSHLKKGFDDLGPQFQPSQLGGNELGCEHKLRQICQYKFNLAFENVCYPGYLSDKLIQSFAAGVIPIYWGDPKFKDTVPEKAVIEMSKFKDFSELEIYLDSMSREQGEEMIRIGQEFIRSKEQKKWQHGEFAKFLVTLLK